MAREVHVERCELCAHAVASRASPDWRQCTAPVVPPSAEFVTHKCAACYWQPPQFTPRSPQ